MDKKKPSAAVKKPRSKGTAKAKALRKKPALKAAHDVDAVSDTGAVGKKAKLTNTGILAAMEGWGTPKPGHVNANDDLDGDSEDLPLTSLEAVNQAVAKARAHPGDKAGKAGKLQAELRDKDKAEWLQKQVRAGKVAQVVNYLYSYPHLDMLINRGHSHWYTFHNQPSFTIVYIYIYTCSGVVWLYVLNLC